MRKITKKEQASMSPQLPPLPQINAWNSLYLSVPNPYYSEPDDIEESDRAELTRLSDEYWNRAYPTFEPELIFTPEKSYFLPALKVLIYADGMFISPGYPAVWEDYELRAGCKTIETRARRDVIVDFQKPHTYADYIEPEYYMTDLRSHKAPDENCDCGIYGSVNLEEIMKYMRIGIGALHVLRTIISPQTIERDFQTRLCLIEPHSDADVIMCRKGWRASHAFISEIVGETISTTDASNLLSIAWHRKIDVARLYENW